MPSLSLLVTVWQGQAMIRHSSVKNFKLLENHQNQSLQGLYENRPRLVKDQVEAVARAKEQQKRLESRQGSNSHQGPALNMYDAGKD